MGKIVDVIVLGDCATNGNNTMGHEIFDDPNITMTFSIQYHLLSSEHAIKWFLKKRKSHLVRETLRVSKLKQIAIEEFNKEFQIENKFQGDYLTQWYLKETNSDINDFENSQHLKTAAIKYLKQRELANSWVNLLDYHQGTIYNYSLNGNHFGNYLIRVRKHIEQYGKLKLILITDYSQDHIFTYVKHSGKSYPKLMSDSYLYMDYNDESVFPQAVYEKRKQKYIKERDQTQEYRDRKSRRYQKLLERYLDSENIAYKYILYRDENFQFVEGKDFIDLRSILKCWTTDNNGEPYLCGENSKKKFDTQIDCAKIVQEHINELCGI
tara:strand:- start:3271 stop:4242 length:972 start_codon:yes stop_codon:yes gene_type:complete